MGPQSCRSFNFGNFKTPTWESHDKMTFGCSSYGQTQKDIIRGKVVASPKSKSWWILWVRDCSWLVYAPKCSNYALTNLLFSLCRFAWIIELFVNLLSPHHGAPTRPFTLKVLWTKERTPTFYPFVVFTFGFIVESIKELGGVSRSSTSWNIICHVST